MLFRPFRAFKTFWIRSRGDALRACPWLSYFAPLALRLASVVKEVIRIEGDELFKALSRIDLSPGIAQREWRK